jgi:hydrogenase/urease accessory protein HupE
MATKPALAHSVSARFGELYSGLLHPLTTLIHLVPWIALGLLAGVLETSKARSVLYAFPAAVAAGALTASVLPDFGWVQTVNVMSFVVLGALVVLSRDLSLATFGSLTVVFGITHGFANNATDLSGGPLLLYVAGIALSAYLTVVLTTAIAHFLKQRTRWGNVAIRAAGSWIIAIGVVFGGYTLVLQP